MNEINLDGIKIVDELEKPFTYIIYINNDETDEHYSIAYIKTKSSFNQIVQYLYDCNLCFDIFTYDKENFEQSQNDIKSLNMIEKCNVTGLRLYKI